MPEPLEAQENNVMNEPTVYPTKETVLADAGVKRTTEEAEIDLDAPRMLRQRQRTQSPVYEEEFVGRLSKRRNRLLRHASQPRWHNQAYMLFLALRQHPDRCLSRPELIKAALALDLKISQERNLPRVFKGKTPANSASASLTTNTDRYFIPFKPEGSRSTHFKLAYEPGDFKKAVEEYRKWEKKLAEHDWPFCFGVPKEGMHMEPGVGAELKEELKADPDRNIMDGKPLTKAEPSEPSLGGVRDEDDASHEKNQDMTKLAQDEGEKTPKLDENGINLKDNERTEESTESAAAYPVAIKQEPLADGEEEDGKMLETHTVEIKQEPSEEGEHEDGKTLEQRKEEELAKLDLSDVPTRWQDIVRVAPSTIPGAGQGLFATRKLPYNIPLGFYFGVPMTEDEFDSLKNDVGRASEYSIMYRRTVLDATDDNGQPFGDPDGEMYCPFHYMNETTEQQANILFVEGVVVNQVICWTKRDIEPGEELFVYYGGDVERHWKEDKKPADAVCESKQV
ncbi:hypothetical protein BCR43DRAFT_492848 [Syncephalastrum racemosum]|uniref:SET domain-containing protein n=1 Tax=Syncephalastrum racemosum TaxID=13706 RepID=A0A1X2H9K4_SYNRA|nr:hypothetical protein BCR43DRAFT_492848 [Syncephalastrum racemosum]